MNGQIWAILSAFGYSGGNITLRLGQPDRPYDDAIFVTALVSAVFAAIVVAWQGLYGHLPPFSAAGFGLLVVQGVLTAYAGRTFYYMAIRRLGPSRASTFKGVAPLFTLALAIPILGERLTPMQWLGIAAIVGALFLLSADSQRFEQAAAKPLAPPPPAAGGSQWAVGPSRLRLALGSGVGLGLLSSACFGIGYLLRKPAMTDWPSPVIGMLIASVVALATCVAFDRRRQPFARIVRETLSGRAGWYYASAACAGFAQLTSFLSFDQTSAALASVLSGMQPICTLLLALPLLRGSERLRPVTVGAILLTVAGAVLLTVTPG